MTLWVRWKGSVVPGNPKLTLAGAKRHACMWAHRVIKQERKRKEGGVTTQPPSKETTAAAAVLEELQNDEREWESWAKDWLEEGLSERACARRHGVSQPAIHYRRKAGMERIRPLLQEHNLMEGVAA